MDWREAQEETRMQAIRQMIREEISAVLEDIREAARFFDTSGELEPLTNQIIRAVQEKIKERGTDDSTT